MLDYYFTLRFNSIEPASSRMWIWCVERVKRFKHELLQNLAEKRCGKSVTLRWVISQTEPHTSNSTVWPCHLTLTEVCFLPFPRNTRCSMLLLIPARKNSYSFIDFVAAVASESSERALWPKAVEMITLFCFVKTVLSASLTISHFNIKDMRFWHGNMKSQWNALYPGNFLSTSYYCI